MSSPYPSPSPSPSPDHTVHIASHRSRHRRLYDRSDYQPPAPSVYLTHDPTLAPTPRHSQLGQRRKRQSQSKCRAMSRLLRQYKYLMLIFVSGVMIFLLTLIYITATIRDVDRPSNIRTISSLQNNDTIMEQSNAAIDQSYVGPPADKQTIKQPKDRTINQSKHRSIDERVIIYVRAHNPIEYQSNDRSNKHTTNKPTHNANNQPVGSLDNPFTSIQTALDHAADLIKQSLSHSNKFLTPHVRILPGLYQINRSIKLSERHSGQLNDPLIIEGWTNQSDQSNNPSTSDVEWNPIIDESVNQSFDMSINPSIDGSIKPLLSGGLHIPDHCVIPANSLLNNPSIKRIKKQVINQLVAVNLVECFQSIDQSIYQSINQTDIPKIIPWGFSDPILPSHAVLYQTINQPVRSSTRSGSSSGTFRSSINQSVKQFHLARYPNNGWLLINQSTDQSVVQGSVIRQGDFTKRPFSFLADHSTSQRLLDHLDSHSNSPLNDDQSIDMLNEDIWMMGLWKYNWAEQAVQIKSIKLLHNQTISQSTNQSNSQLIIQSKHASHYGVSVKQKYFLFNLLSELDEPGEFMIDRSTGWLYAYMYHNSNVHPNEQSDKQPTTKRSDVGKSKLILSWLDRPILEIVNASDIQLVNLSIGYTRSSGIRLVGCTNVSVNQFIVQAVGNVGVMCGTGAQINQSTLAGQIEDHGQSSGQSINESIETTDDMQPSRDHDEMVVNQPVNAFFDPVVGDFGQSIYHKNFLDPLWNRRCGINQSIRQSIFALCGAGGIIFGGGDRKALSYQPNNQSTDSVTNSAAIVNVDDQLTRLQNSLSNNLISHFSTIWLTYRPGIFIDGYSVLVSHNHITNGPHSAIILTGNDHVIESNRLSYVCQLTADVGVVYSGRDLTQRGHILKGNLIDHISGRSNELSSERAIDQSVKQGTDANGLYWDDLASASSFTNNLFYRVHRGVFIGGGRELSVTRNMFILTEVPLSIDSRGADSHKSLLDPSREIMTRWKNTPVYSESWQSRYPFLNNSLVDRVGLPVENLISGNVMIGCGNLKLSEKARQLVELQSSNYHVPTSVILDKQTTTDPSVMLSISDDVHRYSFSHSENNEVKSIQPLLYNPSDPLIPPSLDAIIESTISRHLRFTIELNADAVGIHTDLIKKLMDEIRIDQIGPSFD